MNWPPDRGDLAKALSGVGGNNGDLGFEFDVCAPSLVESCPVAVKVTRNPITVGCKAADAFSAISSARKKQRMAAVTQATCIMSISAAVALSSHITLSGKISAAMNPARRPSWRRKYAYTRKTVMVAASAEGSRAVHSLTWPKGQLANAIAAYIPGGLVKRGSPYNVGTIQLPVRKNSAAMIARRLSLR